VGFYDSTLPPPERTAGEDPGGAGEPTGGRTCLASITLSGRRQLCFPVPARRIAAAATARLASNGLPWGLRRGRGFHLRFLGPGGAPGFPAGGIAVALHVELEDDGVVDQAVDGGSGGHRVLEDSVPGAEHEVRGDHQRPALVALREESEEDLDLRGRTIGDVVTGLRAGSISPDDLPIDVIIRNGETIALNNRSLVALRRAGLEPTRVIDRTGDSFYEALLNSHLGGASPSTFVRIRGGPSNVSWLE